MAIYKIEAPDGSIIDIEGPDDATDEQLIAAASADWSARQDAPRTETTVTSAISAANRGLAPVAGGAAIGAAIGAPIGGVGAVPGALAGATAAALTPIVGDPIVSLANRVLGTEYQLPSEALSDLLTRMGFAESETPAERVIEMGASGLGSAGGIAALGKTLAGARSATTAGIGTQLAAQPAAQLAGGAGAGVASQSVAEAGGGPVAQIAAALAGGLGAAKLAPKTPAPRTEFVTSPAAQAVEDAEQRGISVMTSDVVPPQTFVGKSAQVASERIPLAGTGGPRKAQNAQRIQAIRDTLNDFGAGDFAKASDDVMDDLVKTRGDALTKYATQKKEVIERLAGTGKVPVNNTIAAIDNELSVLAKNKGTKEVNAIIADLKSLRKNIQGKDLSAIEQQRRLLGDKYKNPNLVEIRGEAEKVLSRIYGPLREDMGEHIKTVGERRDYIKWKVANKQLQGMNEELKNTALKSTLRRGNATPEAVKGMLFSQKPSEVRALYSQLSPDGKANARIAILGRAADDAAQVMPDGSTITSPEKFLQQIKKLDPSFRAFFSGDDMRAIDGLTRALNLTRRASEAGVQTKTGQEAYLPTALAGFGGLVAKIGFAPAVASAASVGALARVYESPPVRNLLIKLASTPSGSKGEAEIAKRLVSVIQAQSAKKEEAKK